MPAPAPEAPGTVPRLRVCFVAPHAYPLLAGRSDVPFVGGAELQQCLLARSLARRGHQVSMICLDHGQPDGVVLDGITVHTAFAVEAGIPGTRFFHPRLTGLWRAMRRAGADVYYQRAAGMVTGLVAAFCRRYGKRAVYAGAHDSDFIPGPRFMPLRRDRWLFEYGLRTVDAVVAQNPLQQRLCRENYGREAALVESCYVPPASARRDPDGCVLWVGTLREFKRPELLLQLAALLPDLRFRMVGGPGDATPGSREYARRLEQDARRIGNVEFLGFVPYPEIEPHFDAARILVNTSDREGFPNTFLQAWARAMPTVAFFETGLPPERRPICLRVSDPTAASRLIRRLMTHRDEWEAAGDRSRRYYRARHTPDTVVPVLERILAGL